MFHEVFYWLEEDQLVVLSGLFFDSGAFRTFDVSELSEDQLRKLRTTGNFWRAGTMIYLGVL